MFGEKNSKTQNVEMQAGAGGPVRADGETKKNCAVFRKTRKQRSFICKEQGGKLPTEVGHSPVR